MEKLTFTLPKIAPPKVPVAVQFDLLVSQNPPCYALRFSSDTVLEGAWISCTIPILFLSSSTPTYEMTRTDSEGELKLGNKFSATLRLKPNCRTSEFYFRPVEGYSGTLEIFVSAVNSSGRLTQRESVNLTPLSSYYRIAEVDDSRAYNTLRITGQFSFLKVQSWLQMILQGAECDTSGFRFDEHGGTFAFESMLLHCHLQCQVM
ncbi:hypothetical protein RvY_09702 [Ramazzottius varieornatus]|uniref:BBS7 platform domain-containing protein n=1 Tax=Ramazzottius varieornatus TaxID=947166 RepID=A0A1D1VI39_RAMVA|nr:hypothetical protein RvY_09702 [Ramazzottius varieornatus]